MSEPSWADGYVVDIGYTHGYFGELAPAALHFVSLLDGSRALDPGAPFTYYELGCGNGHSTALHAAANPAGRFYGIDFNPAHIRNARDLADEAGIDNVLFLEKSFAELLESELPEADVVTMHGVHSWISAENRYQVVEFLRRKLKPGGLFFISYNCLPGQVQVAPLQRLMREHASLGAGPLAERIQAALDFARRFDQAGADYFQSSPIARLRLGKLDGMDPNYLAHEYFNANWAPAYHADVTRELAAAKLAYIGSAVIMDNFNQFVLKPEVAKALVGIKDRTLFETLKDYARNQTFRRDVFARGATKENAAELEAWLDRTRFALQRPRALCKLTGQTPVGEITLQAEVYAPVLDALARMPMQFDELSRAAETAQLNRVQLRQAVFGLAALGHVTTALMARDEAARRISTDRYNAAALARARVSTSDAVLASPVLGCGVKINFVDVLLLSEAQDDSDAFEQLLATLPRLGQHFQKDGKPLDNPIEIRARLAERKQVFLGDLRPFLKLVGIVD